MRILLLEFFELKRKVLLWNRTTKVFPFQPPFIGRSHCDKPDMDWQALPSRWNGIITNSAQASTALLFIKVSGQLFF
ncbi:MAG: hypothetical protein ACOYYI_18480 [Chloroflexota bacterium]